MPFGSTIGAAAGGGGTTGCDGGTEAGMGVGAEAGAGRTTAGSNMSVSPTAETKDAEGRGRAKESVVLGGEGIMVGPSTLLFAAERTACTIVFAWVCESCRPWRREVKAIFIQLG